MVHALEEIRRTLRPGGTLIDLRPLSTEVWLEVEAAPGMWEIVGEVDETEYQVDDRAADAAMEETVNREWFARTGNHPFDFRWIFDTLDDLSEYAEEHWEEKLDDALLTRAAERLAALPSAARLCVRREMRLGVYQRMEIMSRAKLELAP